MPFLIKAGDIGQYKILVRMVLDENLCAHVVNKLVVDFLVENSATDTVVDAWKNKVTMKRVRNVLRRFTSVSSSVTPRRVVSKYLYFCEEERRKILTEHPGMNIKAVTVELGNRWQAFKSSPDDGRMAALTEQFELDRQRYATEKSNTTAAASTLNQRRRTYTGQPNPYILFCKEQRSIDPKISLRDIAGLWREHKTKSMMQATQA